MSLHEYVEEELSQLMTEKSEFGTESESLSHGHAAGGTLQGALRQVTGDHWGFRSMGFHNHVVGAAGLVRQPLRQKWGHAMGKLQIKWGRRGPRGTDNGRLGMS